MWGGRHDDELSAAVRLSIVLILCLSKPLDWHMPRSKLCSEPFFPTVCRRLCFFLGSRKEAESRFDREACVWHSPHRLLKPARGGFENWRQGSGKYEAHVGSFRLGWGGLCQLLDSRLVTTTELPKTAATLSQCAGAGGHKHLD